MPAELVTVAGANDTLEAYLREPRNGRNPVYLCALVAVAAALAALPVVKVNVAVTAAGLVRPMVEKREIRVPVAGRVAELLVGDNQRVRAGQPLVRLESADTREQLSNVALRLRDLDAWVADLRLLVSSPEPGGASSPRYRAEAAQLRGELDQARIRAGGIRSQLARAEALFRNQMTTAAEVETLRTQLSEAEAAATTVARQYRARWQGELAQAETERRDLRAQQSRARRTEAEHLVVAPLAGTVEQLAPVARGGVVEAGERFAVISPQSQVIAEVYVGPQQVGMIRRGMPVRVQVDAYRYADWGFLEGRVTDIADDFFQSGDRPVFVVRVALDRDRLTLPNGAVGHLRKGMTLRAHFVLARRSLFQLLRDRAGDWLDPAQNR